MKIKTEIESEPIIMIGRRLFPASAITPPNITGNRGKMHGAKTVNTPAIKDTKNNIMLL